jgi:serine/threonine protein kinase
MPVRIEANAEPIPGYRLIERLGGGGFGEVWKCEAPGGLQKAIKFVFGTLEMAGDSGHRAEQELKALSRVKTVRHPYILSLERFDIVEGQLFIIMELADRNLWDRFKECRSQGYTGIPRQELIGYMQEVAEALDLMNIHYQLQHLDIKPQNLFLVHQHVKVADFGLVKDLEGSQASVTGGITPVYAAPETFDGKVTRYSDQYSLAIVFQELLTAQRPFAGASVRQLILQHLQAEPNLSSLEESDRPIVRRALSKTPEDRYPTCSEFVKALRVVGEQEQVAAEQAPSGAAGVSSAETPPGNQTESGSARTWEAPPRSPPPVPPSDPDRDLTQAPTHFIGVPGTPLSRPLPPPATPFVPAPIPPPITPLPRPVEALPPQPQEPDREGALFPALIVGAGGLGAQVLQAVRAAVGERFGSPEALPNVRTLVVDTDPEVLKQLVSREEKDGGARASRFPLTNGELLLAPLNRASHYLRPLPGKVVVESWLNQRMLYRIPREQMTTGIRALGRLALCDQFRLIQRRLQIELEACRNLSALQKAAKDTNLGVRSFRPRVFLVTGLMGGTGSGMFLDLAYLLRHLLRQLGLPRPEVTGLLFVPRIETRKSSQGKGKVQETQAPRFGPAPPIVPTPTPLGNAAAALAELLHYSRSDTEFQARYYEREPGLQDRGSPFSPGYLLALPGGADSKESREALGMTARFLLAECTSAFGRWRLLGDREEPAASNPRFPSYRTFGLHRVAFPRKQVVREVASWCLKKIVERWLSKDARPLESEVREWVKEQWRVQELGAEHFIGRIQDACQKRLGKDPERAFQSIIEPVVGESPKPVQGESRQGSRGRPAPVTVSPADVQEVLARCEHLLGRPEVAEENGVFRSGDWSVSSSSPEPSGSSGAPSMSVQLPGQEAPRVGSLVQVLRDTAVRIANEWSQKLAELPVKLIEKPIFRLAGAEEAIRQVVKSIEQVLDYHEPLGHELADKAASAYGQLKLSLNQPGAGGARPRRTLTPEAVVDLLRTFPKARYQSLVLQQVLSVYVSMRGCLTDELREINFCRARLKELLALVSPPQPEEGGDERKERVPAGSGLPHPREGRVRHLFPYDWKDINDAVTHVFASFQEDDLLRLDGQIQQMIRSKYVALVQLCLSSKNMIRPAAEAMREVAAAFIEDKLGTTDVASLMLERAGNEEKVKSELVESFEEAVPEPATSGAPRSAHPPGERAVLGTRPTEAGEKLRLLGEQALPEIELIPAVSEEDVILYREWKDLLLMDADVLGPVGQEAYQQLLSADNFTPHIRTDVSFTK